MTFNPIIAVGMSIIRESTYEVITDPSEYEQVLKDFLDGKITRADASSFLLERTKSCKAIDRLAEILAVDENPLPPSNEQFFAPLHASYRGQIAPRKKARPWTEAEDTRLLAGIYRFGLDAWGPVTEFVGSGRSRAQCSQRWFRGLDPRISKVLWTEEEERKLIETVQQYGDHSWTRVANILGNRSDAQCRYHYYQLVGNNASIANDDTTRNNQLFRDERQNAFNQRMIYPNLSQNRFLLDGNYFKSNSTSLAFPVKNKQLAASSSEPPQNLKKIMKENAETIEQYKRKTMKMQLPPISEFTNEVDSQIQNNHSFKMAIGSFEPLRA